jgi:hypothetical protein
MKKIIPILLLISVFIAFCGCEKGKTETGSIQIMTDKETYAVGDKIQVELVNQSDSIARYFVCSSYSGIPPNIYKLENNSWTGYWGPICNGFSSYCCAALDSKATYKDTLNLALVKGIYRIEYQFIVRPSHVYVSFFSNNMTVL